ncbi:MAG: FliH/SctL family protein [Actinomycetes bacterium]
MSSSSDRTRSWAPTVPLAGILPPERAAQAAPARLDLDVRVSRYTAVTVADPRLADPDLEAAFDRALGALARTTREAARAEGYAAGWAQGRRAAETAMARSRDQDRDESNAAEADRARRFTAVVTRLSGVATAWEAQAAPSLTDSADVLARCSYELTLALLGRELTLAPATWQQTVRRAVHAAGQRAAVLVRLNPVEYQAAVGAAAGSSTGSPVGGPAAGSPAPAELALVIDGRPITVRPDDTVTPGDAVVEHPTGRVEVVLAAALDRLRAELAPTGPTGAGPALGSVPS